MTSVKLMLNKNRILNNGSYPLVFQIIHNRRKKLLYTGYRVTEEAFDAGKEKIIRCGSSVLKTSDITKINRELKKIRNSISVGVRQLQHTHGIFTVEEIIASCALKAGKSQFYLLTYIDTQIEHKRKQQKEGTAAAYKSTRSSLAKFLHNSDIRMSDVNLHFVRSYEDFLYSSKVSVNTISYYLRNFRTLYNLALADGCSPEGEYPFSKAQTRPAKTIKRALERKNMKDLMRLELESMPELAFARDLYLFSFYAQGMAFVDITLLKKSDICSGVLTYFRHKSKQLIRMAVTPQMKELIDKYETDTSSSYVFPIIGDDQLSAYKQYRIALARINRHLKKIASMIGVDTPLTTYTARHTWATLARDYGAPISVISAGLGHSSEKMTRIYLKDFDVSILEQVNNAVTNLS